MIESDLLNLDEWTLRVREPDGPGPHPVILMVHGRTGDEESMWIFASRLPEDALLIAPRALHVDDDGGYSWVPDHSWDSWSSVDEFRPAVNALLELLTRERFPSADFSDLRMVGFSQGAALIYTLGLLYPDRVRALAGLAGFVPDGARSLAMDRPLAGKPVFHAHGSRDKTVPVAKAREAVELLEMAGANVTYCEDDVGHKLSITCFRGLQAFFASN